MHHSVVRRKLWSTLLKRKKIMSKLMQTTPVAFFQVVKELENNVHIFEIQDCTRVSVQNLTNRLSSSASNCVR